MAEVRVVVGVSVVVVISVLVVFIRVREFAG